MKRVVFALLFLSTTVLAAQGPAPDTTYDPATHLKQVIGHDPGEAITTPEQIGRYLDALAKAAPDRTRLVNTPRAGKGGRCIT